MNMDIRKIYIQIVLLEVLFVEPVIDLLNHLLGTRVRWTRVARMESDREYKDIKADNVEAEKVFIGICEECSKDAEQDYSKVCPSC